MVQWSHIQDQNESALDIDVFLAVLCSCWIRFSRCVVTNKNCFLLACLQSRIVAKKLCFAVLGVKSEKRGDNTGLQKVIVGRC